MEFEGVVGRMEALWHRSRELAIAVAQIAEGLLEENTELIASARKIVTDVRREMMNRKSTAKSRLNKKRACEQEEGAPPAKRKTTQKPARGKKDVGQVPVEAAPPTLEQQEDRPTPEASCSGILMQVQVEASDSIHEALEEVPAQDGLN